MLINIERIQQGMEQIRIPFLVMHGSADRITNPHGSRELHRRAQSTDKSLKIYEGYVHDLLHEPGAEAVVADVLAWLDAHTPVPAAPAVQPAASGVAVDPPRL